jgi:glycosyltransferase involved in cell wall biosynthesis
MRDIQHTPMPPELSVIVVSFDLARELPRTLYTLSAGFQRGVSSDRYEVLVVDNGSPSPPDPDAFRDLDINLRWLTCPDPRITPAFAINQGLKAARGRYLAVMIDGARMLSPGLLRSAMEALRLSPRAVVGTRGRYLGPGRQSVTMRFGYNQNVEDRMLYRIGWREDGYRLFARSVFDESSGTTWFDPVFESNVVFMSREFWQELEGYDERFILKGGGLVNHDLWKRACESPGAMPVLLLGEASFHQFHGGVSTNNTAQSRYWRTQCEDYERIRGHSYSIPDVPLRFWGTFHHSPRHVELLGGWRSFSLRRLKALLRERWRI